jgi:hypothetical protein
MNVRRTAAALTVTAAAFSGVALVAPTADAKGGVDPKVTTGPCATGSWKLKAKPDDGRVSIEFEVDSNRAGQTWSVRLTDDLNQVFTGSRKTLAPSGSFTVSIVRPNLAGTDTIRARAVNAANGSVCAGRVVL